MLLHSSQIVRSGVEAGKNAPEKKLEALPSLIPTVRDTGSPSVTVEGSTNISNQVIV